MIDEFGNLKQCQNVNRARRATLEIEMESRLIIQFQQSAKNQI
jgi:hypothetical protein